MNLPNSLTILRVAMIPLFVVAMLWESDTSDIIAGSIFILACITDFLDGFIARKYNLVTTFGKFMDPLADKLLVCAAMICFLAQEDPEIPAWVVIVIISREFIISGFRLVAAEKGVTIAASWWGKIKTTVQMLMSLLLIFHFNHPVFRTIDQVFIYLALALTVVSLIDYIYRNRHIMKDIE
ncbi:MAG: CDP-diacylglycerol--glycerol-3-phosphate 3-phosphatidyltransferase [Eubacterium sp.]|nr:CDP-diacylglycerol--glycerol-3-phosphate 3-phosphatidyltransferase [Eubacterium sp.]